MESYSQGEGNHKISFCTTCKGRLDHLKKTLPANIEACRTYPNTEFVILDYDSKDGLGQWIKDNFQAEIKSGLLRYAKLEGESPFKMAHAKNMAHRLATGYVLCNLDADNFLASGTPEYLNREFIKNPDIVVSPDRKRMIIGRVMGTQHRGIIGRIAIGRDKFMSIGGYDEKFSAWGNEDNDFLGRAQGSGAKFVPMPMALHGNAIDHGDKERVENLSEIDKSISTSRLEADKGFVGIVEKAKKMLHQNITTGTHSDRNAGGNFGCGRVRVNFSDEITELSPVMLAQTNSIGSSGRGERTGTASRC